MAAEQIELVSPSIEIVKNICCFSLVLGGFLLESHRRKTWILLFVCTRYAIFGLYRMATGIAVDCCWCSAMVAVGLNEKTNRNTKSSQAFKWAAVFEWINYNFNCWSPIRFMINFRLVVPSLHLWRAHIHWLHIGSDGRQFGFCVG